MKKKITSLLLALVMLFSLIPAGAITAWAESQTEVSYVDADGTTKTVGGESGISYTVVTNDTTAFEDGKWYVVNSEVEFTENTNITVSGTAHLILVDGASLTVTSPGEDNAAICVDNNKTLNIYGQSGGTGTLVATGGSSGAGIGGGVGDNGGDVTINGGTVNATGGSKGAGIGGGYSATGGNVTINGGTVNATGGSEGAGIGGGEFGDNGGDVTINGGTVTATGSEGGAGIGGGVQGAGGSVRINGGTVTATGISGIGMGDDGTGNGTLTVAAGMTLKAGDNAVNAGEKTYTPGQDCASVVEGKAYVSVVAPTPVEYQAYDSSNKKFETKSCDDYTVVTKDTTTFENGKWYVVKSDVEFDGGKNITVSGTAHLILCDGASLTVTSPESDKAAICVASGNTLNIYGQSEGTGILIATGGDDGAGIGGGDESAGGNVTINGGTVKAIGGDDAAGIGGGESGAGGSVTINGGTVTATGVNNGAGIGGGDEGDGGNVTINGGTVTATGGENGAGIGGGDGGAGDVTINGGTVTATGGEYGAGIGGGNCSAGGDVTIYGGTVTATGKNGGAGIGGGESSDGGDVTINGGTVTATGSEGGAGIGAGRGGTSNGSLTVATGLTIKAGEDAAKAEKKNSSMDAQGPAYVKVCAPVSYQAYDSSNKKFETASCDDYTVVTKDTTTFADGGWYVVNSDVEFASGKNITVSGTAHLILCDGATLTVTSPGKNKAAIGVAENNTLNIYGQSESTGALTATGGLGAAGIGGGYMSNGGSVTINGGTVTATGGDSGAGIGGGSGKSGGSVTINGGTVTATGGNARGIGRGSNGSSDGTLTVAAELAIKAGANAGSATTVAASQALGQAYVRVEEPDYLTFTGTEEFTVALAKDGEPDAITLEYKNGSADWENYTVGDAISVAQGTSIRFRAGASGNTTFSKASSICYHFVFDTTGTVAASGSIMSLLDASCASAAVPAYAFTHLFSGCTALTDAPALPATTLAESCYSYMFSDCTALTDAPALPATTLAASCYYRMFHGCTGLTGVPALPATTLADSCYQNMFQYCPQFLLTEVKESEEYTWAIPASACNRPGKYMAYGWGDNGDIVTVSEDVPHYYKVTSAGPVASVNFGDTVGTKNYPSVQAAINAAVVGVTDIAGARTVELLKDVAVSSNLEVSTGEFVILDLKGHVLNLNACEDSRRIKNSGTLEVKGGGESTRYWKVDETTGLWSDPKAAADEAHKAENKTTGGVITGGKAMGTGAGANGGAINNEKKSELTLTDVSIVGNRAKTSGGGVYNLNTLTMTGCTVSGNTAANSGGGVYFDRGTLTLAGATKITGNVSGTDIKSTDNLYLKSGRAVTIGESFSGTVGVTMQKTTGAFTTNGSESDTQYFTGDNVIYNVKFVKGDKEKESTDLLYNDHLELAAFTTTKLTDITIGITLEKSDMTEKQAKAIFAAPNPKDTLIYAETTTAGTYKYVYDYGEEQIGTLADIIASSDGDVYVIGTITEKTKVTLDATVADVDYSGSAVTAPTVTAKEGDSTVTLTKALSFTYYAASDEEMKTPLSAPTDVGDYKLVIQVAADEPNYYSDSLEETFSITPGTNTISGLKIADWTVGGTASQPTATAAFGGEITYEYKVKGAEDSTYSKNAPTEAGEYTLRATSTGDGTNYDADTATVDFTVKEQSRSIIQIIVDVVETVVQNYIIPAVKTIVKNTMNFFRSIFR